MYYIMFTITAEAKVQPARGPGALHLGPAVALTDVLLFPSLGLLNCVMGNWIKMTFKVPFQIHLKKWKNVMLIFLLSIYFLCVCGGSAHYSACVEVRGHYRA